MNYLGLKLEYYGHVLFGLFVLFPVLFSFFFTFYHWWKLEGNWKKRSLTFPLLLLQFWPQYRMIRIIFLGLLKKSSNWKKEKEILQRNISSIGKQNLVPPFLQISRKSFIFLFNECNLKLNYLIYHF